MNILTFDIEEWFLEKTLHGGRPEKYAEYDQYLERILELLHQQNITATFFCLGGMATEFPEVINKIERCGHEVGCHSYHHTWLNKMNQKEVMEDTRQAVDSLEQCIGKKIKSYRAPAFSIGERNKWAFEVLAECGIENDASIYPATRDFGGFANFGSTEPTKVYSGGALLREFPVCTAKILGKEMAFSGGGYFRLLPLWEVKRLMSAREYNMCYFHISDLMLESSSFMSREAYESYFKEKGTFFNRCKRNLKSNIGKKGAFAKMERLIQSYPFVSVGMAERAIRWDEVKTIDLDSITLSSGVKKVGLGEQWDELEKVNVDW